MNEIVLPLFISSLAGLSTLIGGAVVFFKFKDKEAFLAFALSFSLSVMISISVLDLIPSSFTTLYNKYGLLLALIIGVGVFIIGKLVVTKINDKIVLLHKSNKLYRVGVLSMIGLYSAKTIYK